MVLSITALAFAITIAQLFALLTNNSLAAILASTAYVLATVVMYTFGGISLTGLAVSWALQAVLVLYAITGLIKEEF